MNELSYMDKNLALIQKKIEDAKGRRPAEFASREVTLLAAVKYTDAAHINYLHRVLGIHDVGENRVQQLLERWDQLDREGLRVHFIGTLQTNKVKYIIDKVCMIHSLDSPSLAKEIQRQAAKKGLVMDVLAEINSGQEENKSGLHPDEVADFCLSLREYPNIRLRGFMTMAPKCESSEEYRKYFRETSRQCLDIWQKKLYNIGEPILSMGMSGSFEPAIEEGATVVRIGRALFENHEETNTENKSMN